MYLPHVIIPSKMIHFIYFYLYVPNFILIVIGSLSVISMVKVLIRIILFYLLRSTNNFLGDILFIIISRRFWETNAWLVLTHIYKSRSILFYPFFWKSLHLIASGEKCTELMGIMGERNTYVCCIFSQYPVRRVQRPTPTIKTNTKKSKSIPCTVQSL